MGQVRWEFDRKFPQESDNVRDHAHPTVHLYYRLLTPQSPDQFYVYVCPDKYTSSTPTDRRQIERQLRPGP